jgi:hypothetical protein
MSPPGLYPFLNETHRFPEVLKEPASLFFDSEIVKKTGTDGYSKIKYPLRSGF